MRRIEVKLKAEKTRSGERLPLVTLLLLLAGVFGILLFMKLLRGVDYAAGIVFPAAAALCFALWFCYARYRKLFFVLVTAVLLVCVWSVTTRWDALYEQLSHIKTSLSGEAELATESVTHLALLLASASALLLFALECVVKNHALLYLLTSAFLLSAPLLGIHATVETVFLFFLFQTSFWAVQIAARRGRSRPFAPVAFRGASRTGIAASLAAVLAFSVALPVVLSFSEQIFQSVYDAEGFVFRTASSLTGKASEPITGGKISTGNNYRTGAEHLMLTATRQPTETLYLRGFGGGEYIGGDWIRSSDEALFENIRAKNAWKDEYGSIANLYYGMYYEMRYAVDRTMPEEEKAEPIGLTIRHSNHEYDNAYVPYYSERNRGYSIFSSLFYDPNDRAEGYQYFYFEQKDMDTDWDNIPEGFEEQRDIYRELQAAYMAEIQGAYTRIPTELVPRLTSLVEENPLTDLNEITAFILYTLHSNASYSLTPGWTAFNQDIAEYFLFERKEGFCEHFALTATLLYRLYGIPARYATGYKLSPSAFEAEEDGTWQAAATDEDAHAWVEIFLENYGWTPVEVTPADDGSTVVSYPGFDGVQLRGLWKERGWDVSVPSLAETNSAEASNAAETEQSDFLLPVETDWAEHRDLLLILLTCLGYTVLLTPLLLDYRRLRLLRKTEDMNCRALFSRLLETLHFCGVLTEYDGTEEDFARVLSEAVPAVSLSDAERLRTAVHEAAFGPTPPDARETEFVRVLCRRISAELYVGLSWRGKFVFRYIKAFG